MPRISFDDPLPLGMASEAEHMRILVSDAFSCEQVAQGINAHLPDGIRITDCRLKTGSDLMALVQQFMIDFNGVSFTVAHLHQFRESARWPYQRKRRKGKEQCVDLKELVKNAVLLGKDKLLLEIHIEQQKLIRPADFLSGVMMMTPECLQQVIVTKLAG